MGTGLLETLNTHVNAGVNVTGLVVSVYVLALRRTGDLFRVDPASRPGGARIGSSAPCHLEKEKWMNVSFFFS